jgi:hypothetical protein
MLDQQIVGLTFDDSQTRRFADRRLDSLRIEPSVGLGPWPMHRGTLAPVQHTKLNTAAIGGPAHQTVKSVDLANQMTFAESANGRIAGHRTDGSEPVGQEGGADAHSGGRSRGFTAGVAAADYNDVERIHPKPRILALLADVAVWVKKAYFKRNEIAISRETKK